MKPALIRVSHPATIVLAFACLPILLVLGLVAMSAAVLAQLAGALLARLQRFVFRFEPPLEPIPDQPQGEHDDGT